MTLTRIRVRKLGLILSAPFRPIFRPSFVRRLGIFLAALFICSISIKVFARSYDDIKASGYIDVAVYQNFPPYSYTDDKGDAIGIDVDIAKLLAKEIGVEVRWLWMHSDETVEDDLRNAIWKGRKIDRRKADIMMRIPYDRKFAHGVDGYGLPRNEFVVMFAPYHAERWSIARNLEKVGTDRNLAIFRFEKIGVEIDSLPDSFLLSAHRGVLRKNVIHFASIPLAAQALINGDVAAIVGMHSQVVWSLGEHAANFDIDDDGLAAMASKPWSIGMATGHEFRQLSYALEEIIERLIGDGTLPKIFTNYGLDYIAPEQYQ